MSSTLSVTDLVAAILIFVWHRRWGIVFYGGMALLAISGLALIHNPLELTRWITFISVEVAQEFGKAFLVAAILASSVDIYVKRRLVSDFVRDVSPFIEGLGLPQEFQEEIRFIRNIDVYRKAFEITYTIRPIHESPGYVRVDTFIKFDVVNLSGQTRPFSHRLSSETEHQQVGRSEIIHAGARGCSLEYNLSRQQRNFGSTVTRNTSSVVFQKESLVPPTQPSGAACTYWGNMTSVSKEKDSDVFFFPQPTLRPEVRVDCPEDMEVDVYFGHRYQDKKPTPIARASESDDVLTLWQLPAACLTWSAVVVSWRKKTPDQPELPGTDQGS